MHFTAPTIAALAALASTVQAKRHVCNREHYAEVAHNILNPAYFCRFYLKDDRLYSPLSQFNALEMTNLCHCFVQNSPHVSGPRKSGTIPKAQYATCNAQHIRAVKNQYKQPINFSHFFNKGVRKYSPVPSVPNVQALKKAATCIINGNDGTGNNGGGSGGQTTKPATTPAATTPAATTPASSAPSSLANTSPVVVGGTTTTGPAVVIPTTTASSPAVVATTTSAAAPAGTTTTSLSLPSISLSNILPTTTSASAVAPTTTVAATTTAAVLPTTTTFSSASASASSTTSSI